MNTLCLSWSHTHKCWGGWSSLCDRSGPVPVKLPTFPRCAQTLHQCVHVLRQHFVCHFSAHWSFQLCARKKYLTSLCSPIYIIYGVIDFEHLMCCSDKRVELVLTWLTLWRKNNVIISSLFKAGKLLTVVCLNYLNVYLNFCFRLVVHWRASYLSWGVIKNHFQYEV